MQRGIPGFSRAALDVLVNQEQVRALSVGVDPASAPPGVPHNEPFIWRDDVTGAQLIAMWHPRGYGAMSGPHDAALTPPEECVYSPPDAGTGGRHILCFSWRGTNAGPLPDPDAVLEVHAQARRAFPGADVRASTLEAFVDALELHSSSLKVVTGEVGDTWLPGLASDPQKVQQYRAITRMRSQCLWSESCTAQVRPRLRIAPCRLVCEQTQPHELGHCKRGLCGPVQLRRYKSLHAGPRLPELHAASAQSSGAGVGSGHCKRAQLCSRTVGHERLPLATQARRRAAGGGAVVGPAGGLRPLEHAGTHPTEPPA